MAIEIRKAASNDFEQIYSLINEFAAFIKTPERVITTPEQMNNDSECFHCYIAVDGEKIVAFATCFFAYYSWSGKAVYLDDLYVTAAYRGQGVGNLLFNHIIEFTKNNNCKKLKWQVSKWNEPAIAFYESKGAVIDDVDANAELSL